MMTTSRTWAMGPDIKGKLDMLLERYARTAVAFPLFALCLLFLAPAAFGQGCGGCCSNGSQCNNYGLSCNYNTCGCQSVSPVVIDTTGEGFHLTSAENGVMFDIMGDGHPIQIAWTAAGSGNAFLAFDRNRDGKIDSGKELFGNVTQQPPSPDPNGFLALAEFDKPENGGDGDGIIDGRDAVFSHLLLWIDENHDGISQPNELHTLPELGVLSLALKYKESRRTDEFGNQFRYKAAVNPDPRNRGESKDGRWDYDVFLTLIDPQAGKIQAASPERWMDQLTSLGTPDTLSLGQKPLFPAKCQSGVCSMAQVVPGISYKGLPGTGLEIIPPTSQEFTDALKRSADPESLPLIQSILPYSVMIKNGSPEWLFMVTIRIRVVDASGKAITHTVTQGTRDNSHASMIAPGSVIFITPVGGLNAVLPRQGTMHIENDDQLAGIVSSRVQPLSQSSDIEIALDSVVFEDRGLVGPDDGHMMTKLNSWADAEYGVITEALTRHGDDIKSYLESARHDAMNPVNLDKSGTMSTSDDRYFVEWRKSFAGDMLWARDAFSTEEEFFNFLRHKAETTVANVRRRN